MVWGYNIEQNVDEGEQKLHRSYRNDFGPLTVKLVFKESVSQHEQKMHHSCTFNLIIDQTVLSFKKFSLTNLHLG